MAFKGGDTLNYAARVVRYPAKMFPALARDLLTRFTTSGASVMDPFCGSGEILYHAAQRNLPVMGVDINPYAALVATVRLESFCEEDALVVLEDLIETAREGKRLPFSTEFENPYYWFTTATCKKFESLRMAAVERGVSQSREGRAAILAVAFSVRLCSRADDRSPKTFISKKARIAKSGKHIDPFCVSMHLLRELSKLYGNKDKREARIVTGDISDIRLNQRRKFSHIITSPPYLNAQDYFRNTKLELFFLDAILGFSASKLGSRFIGTERGHSTFLEYLELPFGIDQVESVIREIQEVSDWHSTVLRVYFHRMQAAIHSSRRLLKPGGNLVLVCGDNLIAGRHVATWKLLGAIIQEAGFRCIEQFRDEIRSRSLSPLRAGHKGLIKEEVVTLFRAN